MASFNNVILVGNLTRDPELKQIPSGADVAELGLAVNESYKNRSGEQVESVCYVDVVVWGAQAQACAKYLQKGSPVLVDGRLQMDQWETEGQKRTKLRVRANRVDFLSSSTSSEAVVPKKEVKPVDVPAHPFDDDEIYPFG